MMAAADTLRAFIGTQLPGWVAQFGRWVDDPTDRSKRFAVVRPVGGLPAELLRRPQFTVALVGNETDNPASLGATAGAFVAALEALHPADPAALYLQPAEPVFLAADDKRPIFEIAVSAITQKGSP
jgi:hypothetical protein